MTKAQDIFLDHFARLGVFSKVSQLAGPHESTPQLETTVHSKKDENVSFNIFKSLLYTDNIYYNLFSFISDTESIFQTYCKHICFRDFSVKNTILIYPLWLL